MVMKKSLKAAEALAKAKAALKTKADAMRAARCPDDGSEYTKSACIDGDSGRVALYVGSQLDFLA